MTCLSDEFEPFQTFFTVHRAPCVFLMPSKKDQPMNPRDYKIAREFKRRLTEAVELIDFKVYGSKARGDEDEFSDMDVFIEVASLDRQTIDLISDIAWEVGLENLIFISPLVFSEDEIENSPLRASPILININEEGIRL
jgi:predicted nucleotidyltransferase